VTARRGEAEAPPMHSQQISGPGSELVQGRPCMAFLMETTICHVLHPKQGTTQADIWP
jgi:hypothetical protein